MNAVDQRRAWTLRDARMATFVIRMLAKVICAGSMSSVQNPIAVLQASFDSSWWLDMFLSVLERHGYVRRRIWRPG